MNDKVVSVIGRHGSLNEVTTGQLEFDYLERLRRRRYQRWTGTSGEGPMKRMLAISKLVICAQAHRTPDPFIEYQ